MLYPTVRYAYAAAGREWRNDAIWLLGARGYSTPSTAFDVLRDYPVGRTVAVHYDPADPADSALILEGLPWYIFLIGGMGIVWLGVGLFAFKSRVRRRT